MKKNVVALLLSILMISVPNKVSAGEKTLIRATCYTAKSTAVTADGTIVYEGILAGKREWLGRRVYLYDIDGKIIGIYEFRDTGGHEGLKNGTRIDIFRTSLDRCDEWIDTYGDYVYMEVIE